MAFNRSQFPPPPATFVSKRFISNWDIMTGGSYMVSATASNTWSAVDLAVFYPIMTETALSVSSFYVGNGATVAGNVDIGLYAPDGTRIASTGETGQTGTTNIQTINPSAGTFSIGPGLYYLGLAFDVNPMTATARGFSLSNVHLGRAMGIVQQASASPLPSTATFATLTNTTMGIVGMVAAQIPNSYKPVTPAVITPWAPFGPGGSLNQYAFGTMNASSSATWGTANRALYFPVFLPAPTLLTQAFVMAGATWTGGGSPNHFDIGIYDAAGTRIVSTGSTNMNGSTNALQVVNITDTLVGPGVYHLALAIDTTSDAVFRSPTGAMGVACGFQQQTTAMPLPATATFANSTANFLPVFGFTTQAVI